MNYNNICENCGSDKIKIFFYFNEHYAVFFECLECGLIWLDKDKWPSDMSNHYSSVYYDESYRGRDNLNEAFGYRFRMLDKYMPNPGKILEIGAASGDFLSMLKNRGYEVYGVELSKRASVRAKENYGIDLFCGILNDAHFVSGFFDYVVMYHVLEHIPNPKEILREIHRILKPGGILLIEIPDPKSFDAKMSRRLLLSILDCPHHIYAFPQKFLKNIAVQYGFSILFSENSFSFLMADILNKTKKIIREIFGKNKILTKKIQSETGGCNDKNVANMKRPSVFLKIGKKVFPGMKLTVVFKK